MTTDVRPSGADGDPPAGRSGDGDVTPSPSPLSSPSLSSPLSSPSLSSPLSWIPIEARSAGWVTVAVLVAFAVLAVLRNAGPSLTKLSLGLILALALDPLVVAVGRRLGVSRTRAVGIVVGAFAVGTVLLVVFVGPPATRQASQFGKQLPATLKSFEEFPVIGPQLRQYDVRGTVDEWVAELPTRFNAESVQTAAARLLSDVMAFIVVGCVVVGALLDGPRMITLVRAMFIRRPDLLAQVDRAGRVMSITLGQYFGGSLTVAALMGLFVLIVGLALSVPLAPLAALWAAFTDLIPQVGGFLGGSFLVVLALTKGPVPALIAAVLFLIYMNIENHLISPAVVGESVDLTPATTMVAAFIGGAVAGIPGSLVATPLVGATKRLFLELKTGRPTEIPTKEPWAKKLLSTAARLVGRDST